MNLTRVIKNITCIAFVLLLMLSIGFAVYSPGITAANTARFDFEPTLADINTEMSVGADTPTEAAILDSIDDETAVVDRLTQTVLREKDVFASNFPDTFGYLIDCEILYIRELYIPTANSIVAYAFELADKSENYGYFIINIETEKLMEFGAGMSPFYKYLFDNKKSSLNDNEVFIVRFLLGVIENDEVTVIDLYSGEIVAVEDRNAPELDQYYRDSINFHDGRPNLDSETSMGY
ncbi:hypothetical protein FACS1894105_02390 [Clostridia bacterium]|nr:hypothetical protein FACS1894105_02320 [Clostridia bacterium]GHU34850.1 hypothetical protein FACS1894105_02390 [Clostridia bacterium]